jgi:hypothetical protein
VISKDIDAWMQQEWPATVLAGFRSPHHQNHGSGGIEPSDSSEFTDSTAFTDFLKRCILERFDRNSER